MPFYFVVVSHRPSIMFHVKLFTRSAIDAGCVDHHRQAGDVFWRAMAAAGTCAASLARVIVNPETAAPPVPASLNALPGSATIKNRDKASSAAVWDGIRSVQTPDGLASAAKTKKHLPQ